MCLDKVEYDENEFLTKCPRGGKIYHNYEDVTYDKLYSYDFCSAYAYIMTKNNTVPYKRGEFKIVKNTDYEMKSFSKGIYRAIVEQGHKLFTYSKHNYYCDIDLNYAKSQNLKVTLIEDEKPNYLCYTKDKCIKLSVLFKKPILSLFEMKQKGIDGAKQILCIIYGMLAEKHKIKNIIQYSKEDNEINYKIY